MKWGTVCNTRGSGGMPPKFFWCFHALRELLAQSEANNYSTAIASTENHHDLILWLHEAKVYSVWLPKQAFVPLPGSVFAFLVVLHLPAALELRRAGSGLASYPGPK